MSIYFGNDTVNDLYIGLTPVSKGYVGTHLFYNGDNTIIDLTYEKYILNTQFNTLYNTEEAPIKSAFLKGNTLVNINRPITRNDNMKVENGLQILTTWTTAYNLWMVNDITLFKTNTKYYIITEVIDNTLTSTWSPIIGSNDCVFSGSISSLNFASKETGIKCATLTTKSDFTNVLCGLRSATGTKETVGSILKFRVAIIEYQDGMENWDIPYFEGMQSVKMPVLTTVGKNLFDIDKAVKIDEEKFNETNYVSNNNGVLTVVADKSIEFVISKERFEVNTQYTLSFKVLGTAAFHSGWIKIYHTDGSEKILANSATPNVESFIKITSDANKTVDRISIFGNKVSTPEFYDIQVEKGVQSSSYEPYQSNILMVNEPVELRGIGEVKDELDLMTGGVTRRITEVVFDGSENWSITYHNVTNRKRYSLNNVTFPFANYREISDSFATGKSFWNLDETGMYIGTNGKLLIAFQTTDNRYNYTVDEFKKYLSENPVKLQYIIEEFLESTSITAKDQDGNDTELRTFDDITHITLSSEGLIPEAELEVATKNEEVINTMSLEMDDISTTQNALQETSNIQSENVDATMLATTEIYEGLL